VTRSRTLATLTWVIAISAAIASAAGLLWPGGNPPSQFITARGQTVELYGRGLYRYDTTLKAAIFRGTDAVTLAVGVPLLLVALSWYRRGSLRGAVLLVSLLGYFLYAYASLAFGAAYNPLFLLYVITFSGSLFALAAGFAEVDRDALGAGMSERLPHRGISWFLLIAGGVLALVWLSDIVGSLASGKPPPTIEGYTTEVTYVIDLGVVAPATVLAALLLRRRSPTGYVLAAAMLTLNAMIGMVVLAQTLAMWLARVTMTPAQLGAYAGSFLLLAVVAGWLAVRLFRSIDVARMERRPPPYRSS
jgi:hypothetical protein